MRLRGAGLVVALALAAVACGGEEETQPTVTVGPGAESPLQAVDELVEHLDTPDFAAAAALAVPNHAALASLAESATFKEVAEALRLGDADVAANFWSGFAQASSTFFDGEVSTADGPPTDEQGVGFHTVVIMSEAGGRREVLVRDIDGYRVDLFASFGGGLAARMIGPVERLLVTDTEDARLILDELKAIVPSLAAAAGASGAPPEASQHLIQLIELITRLG